ncbi:MAG: hypothetical protein MUO54_09465, partial [Anaerolineales bacterium]|nr:hypothetical protein [Anaerolineales bacterium]
FRLAFSPFCYFFQQNLYLFFHSNQRISPGKQLTDNLSGTEPFDSHLGVVYAERSEGLDVRSG